MRQSGPVTSGISFSFVEGLGALAHGPCVLSQGPGIGLGLRCAFAYLDGLLLSIEIKAIGQVAQDAYESDFHPSGRSGRQRAPRLPRSDPHFSVPASAAGLTPDGQLWHRLEHHYSSGGPVARGASGEDPGSPAYLRDLDLWWPKLPEDARLPLEAGWPELGAPMTTTVLALENLDDLYERVVRLA
ncbi:hypothetical protein Krad_2425 [Kineococcus radiotolerans SRS30216 = ATCC BAA-149]|uniref:Uncharacterized protein n=1 Tax=Kineococcus radiotolerans (strain ATCC BAA-149 / DSM 14245 / SRS30216) TaxID=266940 RepID=A6WAR6_KINRD|nr:hypothetical protein Krad_2425 [Kineococcus radiotolerans SRS30216 = ATCC BAA-149]